MQCLANQLIGDVRTVVVAGVDVVDAAFDCRAQHRKGRVAIFRRSEHARSGELHGAVTHAVHGPAAQRENAGGGDVGHIRSPCLNG